MIDEGVKMGNADRERSSEISSRPESRKATKINTVLWMGSVAAVHLIAVRLIVAAMQVPMLWLSTEVLSIVPLAFVAGYLLAGEQDRWSIVRSSLWFAVKSLVYVIALILMVGLRNMYSVLPICFTLVFGFLAGVISSSIGRRPVSAAFLASLSFAVSCSLIYLCWNIVKYGLPVNWGATVSIMVYIFPGGLLGGAYIAIGRRAIPGLISASVVAVLLLGLALEVPSPFFGFLTFEVGYFCALAACVAGGACKRGMLILAVSGLACWCRPLHLIPSIALLIWAIRRHRTLEA